MYSYAKGLKKSGVVVLIIIANWVAFAGFSDLTIWGLIEQYIKPLAGGTTVGGALFFAINWLKNN